MIINPSHEITLSGLPPDILDAYVRYKKGTRAIVAWIVQYGPAKYHGARSLPLKVLESLAVSVRTKLQALPDTIHFHFRETIAARKRLSKFFRGNQPELTDDSDTLNHEYFTASLTEIYEDLCTCCGKPQHESTHELPSTAENPTNRFASLTLQGLEEDLEIDNGGAVACKACLKEAPLASNSGSQDHALLDDNLANQCRLSMLLQVDDQYKAVSAIWRRSGEGKLHFSSAAVITNVALSSVKQLQDAMYEIDQNIRLGDPVNHCCKVIDNTLAPIRKSYDLITHLQKTEAFLRHDTEGHQTIKIRSCSNSIAKPVEYLQPQLGEVGIDLSRLDCVLAENMVLCVSCENDVSNIVKSSSPVYEDLKKAIITEGGYSNTMQLSCGLHMLSSSYHAYLSTTDSPATSTTCRLTALRLAQQAISSIDNIIDNKTCFPCQCPQTLAFYLDNLRTDLKAYASQRCWDVYFQSPWVAGNHVLEILDLCNYYGQELFTYRHYIGSVLHSYNVLKQLAGLEEMPLFEALCNQLETTFFPGGRPTSNFRACWTRYVGARIKFKKGHRNRNDRDSWCMAIPAHAAKRAAGLGLGAEPRDQQGDSMLFRAKQQNYNLSEKQWRKFTDTGDVRSRLEALAAASERELVTNSKRNLPIARINCFAIFETCVKIVSAISDASHTDEKEQGINCICFANALVDGADRIVNARKMGKLVGAAWMKHERDCVLKLAFDTMRRVCHTREGRYYDAYLWALPKTAAPPK